MPKERWSSNKSGRVGLTRRIDKVQLQIIEALKDCKLDRIGAMSVLLSVALSIAKEETPNDPIRTINETLQEILEWQDPIYML